VRRDDTNYILVWIGILLGLLVFWAVCIGGGWVVVG
jgi:hypothetical protein